MTGCGSALLALLAGVAVGAALPGRGSHDQGSPPAGLEVKRRQRAADAAVQAKFTDLAAQASKKNWTAPSSKPHVAALASVLPVSRSHDRSPTKEPSKEVLAKFAKIEAAKQRAQLKKAGDDEVQAKFDDLAAHASKVKWMQKVKTPAHIKDRTHRAVEGAMGEVIFVERGGCGEKVDASRMGLVRSPQAAQVWGRNSLMQLVEHPGRDSWAQPGSGIDGVVKDEGRSEHGTISGQAPFVVVLKDGYFEVGCYNDVMLESYDKYSNNKLKFKDTNPVSIVHYKEFVLQDEQVPMTPTVCFEFCRTLPNMVFFGINNGKDCYCEPYYKPGPGDDTQCDIPCEGDSTMMCGNQAKSTVYEMHLCDDTAGALKETMVAAKEALDFYFEEVVMAATIGEALTRSGIALEKVAGKSGAPNAADNGMSAKKASSELSKAYRPGFDTYKELLANYQAALGVKDGSFGDAKNLAAAEHAITGMKAGTGPVMGFAEEVHKKAKLAYPPIDTAVFGDDPDPNDPVASALAEYPGNAEGYDFRPAAYAWDTTFISKMSSCSGPLVGSPIPGLGIKQCAKVCEATIYPELCVAFSFYSIKETADMDGKGLSDLCFLLKDITQLETFQCAEGEAALLQANGTSLRGAVGRDSASARATCMVKMSEVSTGYKPKKAKWTKANRCFGFDTSSLGEEPMSVPDAYQSFKMPDVAKMELDGKDTIAAPP